MGLHGQPGMVPGEGRFYLVQNKERSFMAEKKSITELSSNGGIQLEPTLPALQYPFPIEDTLCAGS